ncbi:MAG: hypothetical protein OEV43_05790 [Coriobacteriia bacterium]|nr:hypothetical protein [Coriobacteriia bacterium]
MTLPHVAVLARGLGATFKPVHSGMKGGIIMRWIGRIVALVV